MATALARGARRLDLPAGLPPLPAGAARPRRRWSAPVAVTLVATAPLLLLLISLVLGGGPGNQSADDAVIGMAARDATHRAIYVGPYSRYGWHHPGPTYLYLLSLPTRLWGGSPTGTWVGAISLAVLFAGATVLALHRWGGTEAAWWGAAAVLLVTCGVGPEFWRDPWNPYGVVFPVLFTLIAAALAAAGASGALIWAAVAGSLAVQTHVSTLPVVTAAILVGAIAQGVRMTRRRMRPLEPSPIPVTLPARSDLAPPVPWWRRHPELASGAVLLACEWVLPLWDEAFGRQNLNSITAFFEARHVSHPWGSSWRTAMSLIGVSLGQHHTGVQDVVRDPHPLVTTLTYLALAAIGIGAGIRFRRPVAAWLGGMSVLSLGVAVLSITRIVGPTYKYLLIWVTALPALPILAATIGLIAMITEGFALDGTLGRDSGVERVMAWLASPVVMVTSLAVLFTSLLGLRGVVRAAPAAALTDPDITRATAAVAPVVARIGGPVRFVINDGERWPTAAGVGLQLERAGHAMHVDPQWTFLFGARRRATGREEAVIVVAGSDPASWPLPARSTQIGVAGRARVFVLRNGPSCWWGWVPFGGPACPLPVAPPTAGPPPALPHRN